MGAADPGGAASGSPRNASKLLIASSGSFGNAGIPARPFVMTALVPSDPDRFTAVSIAGPRSPFSSAP